MTPPCPLSDPLEVFYDAQCPICLWEISLLKRRSSASRLRFTPIDAVQFSDGDQGPDRAALLARLHGRDASGQWLVGVDVFRAAYRRADLAWLARLSEWPLLRPLSEWAYGRFVRHRHTLARYFGRAFIALTPDCGDHCRRPHS